MHKFVIMGVQGSGKGTQSKMLCDAYDMVHISVGDLCRAEIAKGTKTGKMVKSLIDKGNLVPDEVAEELIEKRLKELESSGGYLLDGFPRNIEQAKFLLNTFEMDGVILLELPDEVVLERVLSRRLCSECGADYNLNYHPPKVEGRCDLCGGKLVQRADDNEVAVKKRIATYHAATQPAVEILGKKLRVERFDAREDSKDVQKEIRTRFGLAE